jgi:hypothetical protein
MTKAIVAFCCFANAPKNCLFAMCASSSSSYYVLCFVSKRSPNHQFSNALSVFACPAIAEFQNNVQCYNTCSPPNDYRHLDWCTHWCHHHFFNSAVVKSSIDINNSLLFLQATLQSLPIFLLLALHFSYSSAVVPKGSLTVKLPYFMVYHHYRY